MTTLILLLSLAGPALAGPCTPASTARVAAARTLLDEAPQAEPVDQASVVERARILLDRVLAEDPGCSDAKSAKKKADRLLAALTPISQAASFEAAFLHLLERVEGLERAETRDLEEVETVRFMIAALWRRFPGDERLDALARRVDALGGAR